MSSYWSTAILSLRNIGDTATLPLNGRDATHAGHSARHAGYRAGKRVKVRTDGVAATLTLVAFGQPVDTKAAIKASAFDRCGHAAIREIRQSYVSMARMDLQRAKARRIRWSVEYLGMDPRRAMMEARDTLYALSGERL